MPRRPRSGDEAAAAAAATVDLTAVREIVAGFEEPASDLVTVLQRVQDRYGYLPAPVLEEVARCAGVPPSRVYGVATFYAQFSTVPTGRHKVRVCQGTACHVRGGEEVLRAVQRELGIAPGETTPDLAFGLETVACLGACSLAPVMTVDGRVFARMNAGRVPAVLATVAPSPGQGQGSDAGPPGEGQGGEGGEG